MQTWGGEPFSPRAIWIFMTVFHAIQNSPLKNQPAIFGQVSVSSYLCNSQPLQVTAIQCIHRIYISVPSCTIVYVSCLFCNTNSLLVPQNLYYYDPLNINLCCYEKKLLALLSFRSHLWPPWPCQTLYGPQTLQLQLQTACKAGTSRLLIS